MSTTTPEVVARLLRASAAWRPGWVEVADSSMAWVIVPPSARVGHSTRESGRGEGDILLDP